MIFVYISIFDATEKTLPKVIENVLLEVLVLQNRLHDVLDDILVLLEDLLGERGLFVLQLNGEVQRFFDQPPERLQDTIDVLVDEGDL